MGVMLTECDFMHIQQKKIEEKGNISIDRSVQRAVTPAQAYLCIASRKGIRKQKCKRVGQPTVSWEKATAPNRNILTQCKSNE
jgi:hypothetical protein